MVNTRYTARHNLPKYNKSDDEKTHGGVIPKSTQVEKEYHGKFQCQTEKDAKMFKLNISARKNAIATQVAQVIHIFKKGTLTIKSANCMHTKVTWT
tara:strand:- start:4911 stop:5198 length:288 start_codon:yes stop_codon:yes gene_type:complete